MQNYQPTPRSLPPGTSFDSAAPLTAPCWILLRMRKSGPSVMLVRRSTRLGSRRHETAASSVGRQCASRSACWRQQTSWLPVDKSSSADGADDHCCCGRAAAVRPRVDRLRLCRKTGRLPRRSPYCSYWCNAVVSVERTRRRRCMPVPTPQQDSRLAVREPPYSPIPSVTSAAQTARDPSRRSKLRASVLPLADRGSKHAISADSHERELLQTAGGFVAACAVRETPKGGLRRFFANAFV